MKYILSFLTLILICSTTNAQRGHRGTAHRNADFRFIADKDVNFGPDYDVINFGNLNDDFRALKIHVKDAPLHIGMMKIHYDNGQVQNVELKNNFRQGDWSRVIDLDGGMRHLRKIEFWYSTNGILKGKSRVAVWGR